LTTVRYAVRHETLYCYERRVAHAHQQLHLTPRSFARQRCLEHGIQIDPEPAVRNEYIDAFGNGVTRVELDRPHEQLQVIAQMQVNLEAVPELPVDEGEAWEQVRDQLCYHARTRDQDCLEAMRFKGESPYVRIKRVFSDFAQDCLVSGGSVLAVASALMNKLHEEFTYTPGATEITTPLLEVFHKRQGVCQDYAHLMIACLRSAGLAARYVSGYLHTGAQASDGNPSQLVGADASHAWVSVFAPPHGWVEFDPTNNLLVQQDHVALAWGRDFGDVSPLWGVILGGGEHTLEVRVAVHALAAPAPA
jgi:transglutaminase-like putative cysteine protease